MIILLDLRSYACAVERVSIWHVDFRVVFVPCTNELEVVTRMRLHVPLHRSNSILPDTLKPNFCIIYYSKITTDLPTGNNQIFFKFHTCILSPSDKFKFKPSLSAILL